jgi:myo-inositol-1(or 4)-monophosphatase
MDGGSQYTWVVDPLDGTSNFVAGLPWFGVLLAYFKGDEPVLAGMYLPLEDQLYAAEKGRGARRNEVPIRMSTAAQLSEVLISYSFDYSELPGKTEAEMALIERLVSRVRNIRSTNSLYDFCGTADGRLGASLNQTTKIWDIAAPWLVIREAGGVVTDIEGGDISFDVHPERIGKNYTIAASAAGIQAALMSVLVS